MLAHAELGRESEAREWLGRARPWLDGTVDAPVEPGLQRFVDRAVARLGIEFERPIWWMR